MKIKQSTADNIMDEIAKMQVEAFCLTGEEEISVNIAKLEKRTRKAFVKICKICNITEVEEGV